MAARIGELSFSARAGREVEEPAQLISPAIVDAAVDAVLKPYADDVAEEYRRAWGADESSEVAHMLHGAIATRSSRLNSYAGVARTPVTVSYVLSDEDQRAVVERYPDMNIRFTLNTRHDHALGAADRKLSSILLQSRIPAGVPYVDFGGAILMHVENGNSDVLVVGGLHDAKDRARATLINMRLKVLASDPERSEVTRRMAASVLAGEGRYYVDGSLETFTGKFSAGVMSHVYDVDQKEVAKMMRRCGMLVLEGVMHFSHRFFLEDEGEMPTVGARFRISKGKFEMGFVDAPSHWYGHDWKRFSAYGVDQNIVEADRCYSYKIHERRGDTISFRFMALGGKPPRLTGQVIARPGVPMVRVDTYHHRNLSGLANRRLASTVRYYPEDVWESMVREAMVAVSKGTLNYNKLVKSYKDIVAGHKYNGVSTVSECIDVTSVPWIVVDAAMHALGHIMRLRQNAHVFVVDELEKRTLAGQWIPETILRVFWEGLKMVLVSPFYPWFVAFEWLLQKGHFVIERIVEVAPVARLVNVDTGSLFDGFGSSKVFEAEEFPLAELHVQSAALDEYVAKVLEIGRETEATKPVANRPVITMEGEDITDATGGHSETCVDSVSEASGRFSGRPSWLPVEDYGKTGIVEVYERRADGHTPAQRVESVAEAVRVVEAESRELTTWCMTTYALFAGGRNPSKAQVKEKQEQYNGVDFWPVNSGIIGDSLCGVKASEFSHAGVYCPHALAVESPDGTLEETHLVPVTEVEYEDKVRGIFRVHNAIPQAYTGLVMTSDGMRVMNGTFISSGLKVATSLACDYEAGGMVGGPGCGKSTTILARWKRGDLIVTPLKKSATDMRDKLVSKRGLKPNDAYRCVRTVDSILCAAGRGAGMTGARLPRAHTVHYDECYNTIPGRGYAAMALVGARLCLFYGDNRQIVVLARANITVLYTEPKFEHVVWRWTVFRPPAVALACYNPHYGNKLRTASKVEGSVQHIVGPMPEIDKKIKAEDALLLVMNQANKKILTARYPWLAKSVFTTHESQGGEAEHVFLFNFEPRQMSDDNPMYLYKNARYVNVAISRSKKNFTYISVSRNPDTVTKFIEEGSKLANIVACTRMDTAGTPY